ncbi:sulfite exporter TauE/SafE family protein [Candidatus Cloacimonadota bacterium]
MIQSLLNGWFLGIATGTTCLSTCVPIYIPYLLTEERTGKQSFLIILEITIGRFLSYAGFGAIFGFIGSSIPVEARQIFTSIAYILLSIYLVVTFFRIRRHKQNCTTLKWMKLTKSPLLLGMITGVSFCPAFLIAISNAVDVSGALAGMTLFIGFFFGTSIFLLPLTFLGALSKLSNLRKIALIASIVVAGYFTYKGITGLIHFTGAGHDHTSEIDLADSLYIAEPFMKSEEIVVIAIPEDSGWDLLISRLEAVPVAVIKITDQTELTKLPFGSSVIMEEENKLIKKLPEENPIKLIKINKDKFHTTEDWDKMINFLQNIYFRYNPEEGYEFLIKQPPARNFQ